MKALRLRRDVAESGNARKYTDTGVVFYQQRPRVGCVFERHWNSNGLAAVSSEQHVFASGVGDRKVIGLHLLTNSVG